MLLQLARQSFRKRRLVLALWVAFLIGLSVAGTAAGGANFRTDFNIPGAESVTGINLLTTAFPGSGSAGFGGQVVFVAEQGVDDPAVQKALTGLFSKMTETKGIRVISPFSLEGQQQVAQQGEYAGKLAYARVEFPPSWGQGDFITYAPKVSDAVDALKVDGLRVELGGEAFAEFEVPSSEVFGIVFAIFILLIAFGSVLAMGLPIGVALFGIAGGVLIVNLLSRLIQMPDFTLQLAAMIGLGVGIDYALFIVTRYRENLHLGQEPEEATVAAIDTAGRAVMFAGITVIISLMGMFLMGLNFVRGLAIGASLAVLMTMVASVTLLPALLGFAGHRIEVTRRRGIIAVLFVAAALFALGLHATSVTLALLALAVVSLVVGSFVPALKVELPRRKVKAPADTVWYKWSRFVEHRPWPVLFAGLITLLVLGAPVLQLRLGQSDSGNAPAGSSTKQAYDLLSDGFGPGSNGPLLVVADTSTGADPVVLDKITAALQADPNVAFASPAQPSPKGEAAQWFVIPKSAPQDEATDELVARLRSTALPAAVAGSTIKPYLTGSGAINVDFAAFLARRLPLFIGVVLALSFLLLMAVFRSVLVPLKAVIMNLLSIGAAYGVVVMVFQWGWLSSLVGVSAGPIDAWAPMMLFAIVFGLSMDYEVFLLSRMREEFDRTGDNASAVADGLASTARVITAAAAIMVFVFGSFLLEPNRQIKLFGAGLAIAVFLDATIVRMLLVPATMQLLGAKNWWMPKWLDKLVPKLNVEGSHHEADGRDSAAVAA
jgi:putative drug exporter of the RND superfamily